MNKPEIGLKAEITKGAASVGQFGIIGGDHSAFASRNVLVWVEAKSAYRTKGTTGSVLVGSTDQFGSVFDDGKAVALSEFEDRVNIHRQAVDVHHHDRRSAWGDDGGDLIGHHVPSVGVGVDEHGGGAGAHDGGGAGDDREGGHDHLVAGAELEGGHSDVESGAAVGTGYAVLAAHPATEGFLELAHERSFRGDPAGVEALHHELFLSLAYHRFVDGDEVDHCVV